MRSVTGLALAATLTLFGGFSCSGGHASGTVPDGVQFHERVAEGHVIVGWYPDEDCLLAVSQGADSHHLDGVRVHCTAAELAEGRRLVAPEAWAAYESADVPSVPLEMTSTGGAQTSGAPAPPPPTSEQPVGSISVHNGLLEEGDSYKTFWADDLGPNEAELVAYFRRLHEKYGDFE